MAVTIHLNLLLWNKSTSQACESLFSSRHLYTVFAVVLFWHLNEEYCLCTGSMWSALEYHPTNDKLMMKRPRKLLKLDFDHLQHINGKLSWFNHISLLPKVQSNWGHATPRPYDYIQHWVRMWGLGEVTARQETHFTASLVIRLQPGWKRVTTNELRH